MKWPLICVALVVSYFIVGLLVFLTSADFTQSKWINAYHIWDKGKDLMFMVTVWQLLPKYRKAIRWIIVFCAARFLWEFIAAATGQDINSIRGVNYLFIGLISAMAALMLKDLRQWQK